MIKITINQPRKFTFRCEKCQVILVSAFEDDKDIEDVIDGLLWLECQCGSKCLLLTD
jgi:hypothetical protein